MKNLLFVIALLLAPRAIAADPVVVVTNASSVTVDGVPSGSVVDVLANVTAPNIRARLLDALIARETAILTQRDAAINTANAAAAAAVSTATSEKVAAVAAAVAEKNTAETAKTVAVAKTAAIIAALKGLDPAALPANVKAELQSAAAQKKAALQAQKAAVEAELAQLP